MADSKRQRIIDAIVTRMLLINGSGSYTRNVGTNVEDSRTNWDEDDLEDYDAISVFDGDALANPSSPTAGYQAVIWSMPVLIRAFAKQGSSGPANVRNLIKDINTAIKVDDTWSGIAMQTRQIKEAVVRNPDSFEIEAAEVEIEVQYKTSKFNSES
jgi:hypothetical protein